ncbi:hypothetical protein FQ087_00930 [Sporosarcina sp. ANT_H38]|uniref:hypothetical protein n=1 Tax=Sporosarcina sp. ANT_H38 TaxID=2597358 RepID=UPI0011F3C270|nr:hypothetical protein [Sporosarcina sp. ANT_H38]KAA0964926.1 hypothetical protein FQ087_00930 [Sporosarcina sp. ANT_H38]
MTKKKMLIIAVIILFAVLLVKVIKKELREANETLLKQEVLSIKESAESVNLSDVTPFEWDLVYSFDPYTSKDAIYETVGYKWGRISETVSEGMNQLVFMKDGKVVCYVYGYPANNGYGIYFMDDSSTESTPASLLSAQDDLTFQVDRRVGYIYLMKN